LLRGDSDADSNDDFAVAGSSPVEPPVLGLGGGEVDVAAAGDDGVADRLGLLAG